MKREKLPRVRTEEPSAVFEATRLLGKWTRLAQGHVPLAMGCSCGAGFASIQVQDFEQDIFDFLRSRHPSIAPLAGGKAKVADLLRTMVRQPEDFQPGEQLPLLADLERIIDSFEQVHRR